MHMLTEKNSRDMIFGKPTAVRKFNEQDSKRSRNLNFQLMNANKSNVVSFHKFAFCRK